MVTNYEKYLVLVGFHHREDDQNRADRIADDLDKLFHLLSDYQKSQARQSSRFLLGYAEGNEKIGGFAS